MSKHFIESLLVMIVPIFRCSIIYVQVAFKPIGNSENCIQSINMAWAIWHKLHFKQHTWIVFAANINHYVQLLQHRGIPRSNYVRVSEFQSLLKQKASQCFITVKCSAVCSNPFVLSHCYARPSKRTMKSVVLLLKGGTAAHYYGSMQRFIDTMHKYIVNERFQQENRRRGTSYISLARRSYPVRMHWMHLGLTGYRVTVVGTNASSERTVFQEVI